jgi:Pectinacetylesterase
MKLARTFLGVLLATAACSDDQSAISADAALPNPDASVSQGADAPRGDAGTSDAGAAQPIQATPGTWTWVDFPDSSCDDGSPTGIGVNLSATSSNVFIYLEGGGACATYDTCVASPTYTKGPFGKTQFDTRAAALTGVLDRAHTATPVHDWNLVYIPYCTGDVHSGNNVATYTSGSNSAVIHHVGHANVLAYLRRLAVTFPNPPKLVVSGSSAGGYGATGNYFAIREAMAPDKSYLIDDSGPSFHNDPISNLLLGIYQAQWHLHEAIAAICDVPCTTDLSALYTALSARYPSDRLALLSSLQDAVIRMFLLNMDAPTFQINLLDLGTSIFDPTSNFKYFFVTGDTHTMLGHPQDFTSNSKNLDDWLTSEINDGADWVSEKPAPTP